MKKQIIAGIGIIACVALCAAVWQRSTKVEELPADPVKNAVSAEIEARSEETPHIFISEVMPVPVAEAVAESEPKKTETTAEKETQKPATMQTAQSVKPSTTSSEPHMGDVRVVDGEKQVYILDFGWIKDEGGENVGTVAADMYENPATSLQGTRLGLWAAQLFTVKVISTSRSASWAERNPRQTIHLCRQLTSVSSVRSLKKPRK